MKLFINTLTLPRNLHSSTRMLLQLVAFQCSMFLNVLTPCQFSSCLPADYSFNPLVLYTHFLLKIWLSYKYVFTLIPFGNAPSPLLVRFIWCISFDSRLFCYAFFYWQSRVWRILIDISSLLFCTSLFFLPLPRISWFNSKCFFYSVLQHIASSLSRLMDCLW